MPATGFVTAVLLNPAISGFDTVNANKASRDDGATEGAAAFIKTKRSAPFLLVTWFVVVSRPSVPPAVPVTHRWFAGTRCWRSGEALADTLLLTTCRA